MVYLYTRVSTGKQRTETQEYDLSRRFPGGVVVRETASGVKSRPELQGLLAKLQPGDTLAVAALDRLGRKLSEILLLIEDLYRRGVILISLREGVDYSTPSGRLITQVLLAVAELERCLTGQRTSATLQALKAKGVPIGRPREHSQEMIDLARTMREKGEKLAVISAATKISVTRLYELLDAPRRLKLQELPETNV